MGDQRTSLCAYLPSQAVSALSVLPKSVWDGVGEVRLRAGRPLAVTDRFGTTLCGEIVTASQVQACFLHLCDHSVHTHQEELQHGFITTTDGFRVGIGGTAVIRDGCVTSYRDITSLCIRIPREVIGCSIELLPSVEHGGRPRSLLLCGPPGSGKTTILRDLAQQLSKRHNVSVVDERREIAALKAEGCDVLSGCPKAVGILQAVRTLSPDVVIFDEIGDRAEWQAVSEAIYSGVAVIASMHAYEERELTARAEVTQVLKNGGFSRVAFLSLRRDNTRSIRIRKAAELFEDDRSDHDRIGLYGCGRSCGVAAV